jgi:hypothetical protein
MTKEIVTTENKFVVKFDYNMDILLKMVEESKNVDITNIEAVEEEHKKFVKVRTTIKRQEKEMVDEANKFRNTVFEERDKYLEVSVPVEEKFKKILEEEKQRQIVEVRKELLPMKQQQLSLLDIVEVTDDFILTLDDEQWVAFYNEKVAEHKANIIKKEQEAKAEQERKEREERIREEAKQKAEREKKEAELKAEQEKRDLIAKAEKDRVEALAKAEQDKKDAIAKLEKEQKEKEEKAIIEKALKEKAEKDAQELKTKQEKEAQEKLEADKKYQKFLKDNNYNEKTDIINNVGDEVRIYRLVATLK